MKLTYCGIAPTAVKIFWKNTEVKRNDVIELEEADALQLLNGYSNIFAPTWNKELVERLLKLSDEKEKARQLLIDAQIKEKLVIEENKKKQEILILERRQKEKELANKQAINKQEKEISNIETAMKLAEDKKIDLKLQMDEDKKEMDKRIKKIKDTLINNK